MTEIKKNSGQLLHNFMIFEYSEVKPSKSSDGIVTMKGVVQKAQQPNANNRIYPRAILEREDAKYQELIKERRSLGELDHPDSPIVQLENVSHLITETNWDGDDLGEGSRNFGHLAYHVDNIYQTCSRLKDSGVTINRPPRDGYMAFVRSPDNISIELLQKGLPLKPKEPWVSMENIGEW